MTKRVHVAVLECDTPIDPVKERYGSYGDFFERLLKQGLDTLGQNAADVELAVSKWPVVERETYPNPQEVDAILLTGSRHNAFSNDSWIVGLTDYIRDVIERHPQTLMVGICFGHQIIGRALDARVDRNSEGWEIAVDKINLSETGKQLFGKEVLSLHQMHRDIVYEVPKDCINLGSSSRCQVQGFYRPKQLLTVQGHPEFDEFTMNLILEARYQQKIFDEKLYDDGKSRAGLPHDGVIVAAAIGKFLLGLQP